VTSTGGAGIVEALMLSERRRLPAPCLEEKMRRKWMKTCSVGVLGLLLSACGGTQGSTNPESTAKPPKTVRFAVGIRTADVAQSYYSSLPDQLGYWKSEGLDVTLQFFDGDANGLAAVASGNSDASISGTSTIAVAREKGTKLMTYMVDAGQNLYAPAAPVGGNIKTLADYKGKTVGVQSLGATSYLIFKGILKQSNVDPTSVQFVPVGTGAEVAQAIKSHRIDTYQASTNLYAALRSFGVDLQPVPCTVCERMGFGTALETPESNLKNDPETYTKLARGIAKARAFAAANPRAAVLLHWKTYPASKPTSIAEEVAITNAIAQLKGRLASAQVDAKGVYGRGEEKAIDTTLQIYEAGGVITKPQKAKDIYTARYIDQINSFDLKTIQRQAENYQVK
jgi:NitT/TauT family transport system substrate-binding protein